MDDKRLMSEAERSKKFYEAAAQLKKALDEAKKQLDRIVSLENMLQSYMDDDRK